MSQERYAELGALEEWILTVTAGGFGKRSSAHEYRVSGRGGQGVAAANLSRRDDRIVAAFTVEDEDQIMLATSTGQSIRCPVMGISRQGRASSGVTIFNTKDGEEVVSVAYIAEQEDEEDVETTQEE
jgi:DNA gyrase subunit A